MKILYTLHDWSSYAVEAGIKRRCVNVHGADEDFNDSSVYTSLDATDRDLVNLGHSVGRQEVKMMRLPACPSCGHTLAL